MTAVLNGSQLSGKYDLYTVGLTSRHGNSLLLERIDMLRRAFHDVRIRHPFKLDAIIVLPNHLV